MAPSVVEESGMINKLTRRRRQYPNKAQEIRPPGYEGTLHVRVSGRVYIDIMMTPELAQWILDNTPDNFNFRKVNEARKRQYAIKMLNKEWEDNAEPIRLTAEWYLIDGQHRLLGVIMSGVTVPMTLVIGCETEESRNIDMGQARQLSHHLSHRKEKNAIKLAAALKIWACALVKNGNLWDSNPVKELSINQLLEILEDYPELREWTQKGIRLYRKMGVSAGYTAVAFMQMAERNEDLAKHYYDAIDNMMTNDGEAQAKVPHDHVARVIRNKWEATMKKKPHERANAKERTSWLIRGWNALRQGKHLTRIAAYSQGKLANVD